MHPHIRKSLNLDSKKSTDFPPEIVQIMTKQLIKKCLILNSKKKILRSYGVNQLQIMDINSSDNKENILTFPGVVLDFIQNSESTVIVIGCTSNGTYMCRFIEDQLTRIRTVFVQDVEFIEHDRFVHQIHDLGKQDVLMNSPFHYSILNLL